MGNKFTGRIPSGAPRISRNYARGELSYQKVFSGWTMGCVDVISGSTHAVGKSTGFLRDYLVTTEILSCRYLRKFKNTF